MSLTRNHHAPLEAFKAVDAGNTGSLSISSTRKVLQNLGLAPTALEMASYARTFGDGKSIDYKRFIDAHESITKSQVDEKLVSNDSPRVGDSSSNRPTFSPLRTQRSAYKLEGNIARPDGSYPRPEDAKDSVLLKFESDTATLPGIVHGNPGLLLSLPNYHKNSDKVRTSYPHKLSMSSSHQVMQTVFNEQVAADAEADKSDVTQHLNESRRMMSPVAHTLGSIENTGGVINFMASEPQHERKLDTSHRHASGLDDAGGIASWVTKPEDLPEGYLPALPKDHNGALQRKAPSRGIEGHLLEPTGTSLSSGTAAWGEDSAGYMREWDLHRHLHEDPLYHTSEIQTAGGLSGLAGAERTWLEETRTAPGKNVMENPHREAGEPENVVVSSKKMVEGRRRSVPDLITKAFKELEEEKNDVFDNSLDVEALEAGDESDVSKLAQSVTRAHRGLFKKHFQTGGPITDSITGAHIEKPVAAFGAWSPHAVSMATHVLRPDLHRLAIVRKHLRSMLPSKASSAAAVIRSRLGGRDGDKDGKVTDYELLSALSSMMPEVQAEEVGLLIRHIRSRAMRKNANASSTSEPTEAQEVSAMAITTAGFGEGINIADIADWVTLQPGGNDQVTASNGKGKVNDSLDSAAVSRLLCDPEVDNQLPPVSGGRISKTLDSARVSNLLNDPVVDTNDSNAGFTPSSQTFYADVSRFAEEAAMSKYKPALRPMDSSATHRTIFGDNANTFVDARAEAMKEEEERLRQLEEDAESIAASYVTAMTSSGRKKNPGSVSYAHFHESKRAAASSYAKGSSKAPAAGLLSGGPKDEEDKGKARADQERIANLAKFESFRVSWEEKHGAAGRKEMALDAQIAPEGPTWTRAAPQAYRVLKLASAAPLSSPINTNKTNG